VSGAESAGRVHDDEVGIPVDSWKQEEYRLPASWRFDLAGAIIR
jgi:hypothetical protein